LRKTRAFPIPLIPRVYDGQTRTTEHLGDRMLTRRTLLASTGNLILASTAIGVAIPLLTKGQGKAFAGVRVYKDIRVVAIGAVTPLSAAAIASGMPFSGKVDEGSHMHAYTLTAAQIKDITAGKTVKVDSGLASDGSGHKHTVTVNPATVLKGGATLKVFESENADLLAVKLGKGEEPYVYVEGAEELDPTTVKMCMGDLAVCQEDGNFSLLELVEGLNKRQVFSSIDHIAVQADSTIHVWATSKNGKVARIIATVNK